MGARKKTPLKTGRSVWTSRITSEVREGRGSTGSLFPHPWRKNKLEGFNWKGFVFFTHHIVYFEERRVRKRKKRESALATQERYGGSYVLPTLLGFYVRV